MSSLLALPSTNNQRPTRCRVHTSRYRNIANHHKPQLQISQNSNSQIPSAQGGNDTCVRIHFTPDSVHLTSRSRPFTDNSISAVRKHVKTRAKAMCHSLYTKKTADCNSNLEHERIRKVRFKQVEKQDIFSVRDVLSYEDILILVAGFHLPASKPYKEYYYVLHGIEPPRPPCLQLAEFFYRSAQQLGYINNSERVWHADFRTDLKFTVRDVKRWRRLAHFDWEHLDSMDAHGAPSKTNMYGKVYYWFHRQRSDMKNVHHQKVSESQDLSCLCCVINSSLSFGAYHFKSSDIFRLCNINIEAFV